MKKRIIVAGIMLGSYGVSANTTNVIIKVITNVVTQVEAGTNVTEEADVPKLVSAEEFEAVTKDHQEYLTSDFEEKYPMFNRGDDVRLTLPSGIIIAGVLHRIRPDEVVIKQGSLDRKLPFTRLRNVDRVRLDTSFREEWIEYHARVEARQDFEDSGRPLPQQETVTVESMSRLLKVADPVALRLHAEEYIKGLRYDKDFGYGFLFNLLAAKQDDVEAKYNLGRMYYDGISIQADKKTGIQLIASAANDGNTQAEKFLQYHKVSQNAARKAAEYYAEKRKKEREAHIRSVERFNKTYTNRRIQTGKKESFFNRDD